MFDLFLALVFTNLDWIQIGIVGAGVVCGCGVRPLQNQCAHTCVCGSESGCAVCVRATRKWVATHPLLKTTLKALKTFVSNTVSFFRSKSSKVIQNLKNLEQVIFYKINELFLQLNQDFTTCCHLICAFCM